jgi:mono/diheme cytochrome c family protein
VGQVVNLRRVDYPPSLAYELLIGIIMRHVYFLGNSRKTGSGQAPFGAKTLLYLLVVRATPFALLALFLAAPGCFAAAANAERGGEVLRRENCLLCHSLRGEGGNVAPDLARRIAQDYTPAALASLMWNHAPNMWAAMSAKGVPLPKLSQADSEDLFAYLYSVRFFDRPGDAGRGKQLFDVKHCSECHSLTPSPAKGPGNPVSTWKSLSDPMMLVERMWNHSGAMRKEMSRRQLEVTLTGPELSDLTVYLQNFPPKSTAASSFNIPDPAAGKPLFDADCAQCHKGSMALDRQAGGRTLTDIAAGMWNHVPRMLTLPMVRPDDMSKIVSYVWEQQYLGPAGSATRGKKAFEEKRCASCHDDANFSAAHFLREGRIFTPLTMVTVVWSHGPQMQEQMKQHGVSWPRLTPDDIGNLVAYLNTRP